MVRLRLSPSILSGVEGLRYYPVGLNLVGKNVLVAGAGRVAEHKIKTLLSFGAHVGVVAPEATRRILVLARSKKIDYKKRAYRLADVKGKQLVIAATSDRRVNEQIAYQARKRNIWVNVVDQTAACEFISPAVIRRHGLVISVSTDGKNPRRSKQFKDFLKRKLNEFRFSGDKL